MKPRFTALPDWAEFALVIGLGFGFFIANSFYTALHPATWGEAHHSNGSLISLSIYEVVVGGGLFLFLLARGWTFKRLGLTTQLWDGSVGLVLAFLSVAAYVLLWNVLVLTLPDAARLAASVKVVQPGIPLAVTLTLPWINGLFEEVFVAGYVISALKGRWGEQVAINASVALRLSYHLYQNAAGVIAILPLGLIFGYWYARTGRLWPLIVAHAALDLVAFLAYTQF